MAATVEQIQQWTTLADPESVGMIVAALLESAEPAVRNAALIALGKLRPPGAVAKLIAALAGDNRAAKIAAAEALGRIGDARAINPLIELVAGADLSLRLKAMTALGALEAFAAAPLLIPYLKDPIPAARMLAAEALGKVHNPVAVDPMLAALNESHAEMRRHLTAAQESRVKTLAATSRAQAEEEWVFQWALAQALGAIGDPKAGAAILAWGHRVFSSNVRRVSADDKIRLVREVSDKFFKQQEKDELYLFMNRLQSQIKMMSWQKLSSITETSDWIEVTRDNPIWTAINEELMARTGSAGPSTPNPGATRATYRPGSGAGFGSAGSTGVRPAAGNGLGSPSGTGARPAAEAEGTGARAAGTGGGVEPSLRETPAPAMTQAKVLSRIPMPNLISSDFLAMLKRESLASLVLVGGALRDAVAGRAPRDLDIALRTRLTEDQKRAINDVETWNAQFAGHAMEVLNTLAKILGCPALDIIRGRAVFEAEGNSIAIHYVGPYVIETIERARSRGSLETRAHRVQSRLGLVADQVTGRLWGPAPVASVSDMWLETDGQSAGNYRRALMDLVEKTLEIERAPEAETVGWEEFAHMMALKLELQAEPGPQAQRLMSAAATKALRNPEAARAEFDGADLEKIRRAFALHHANGAQSAEERLREEFARWGLADFALTAPIAHEAPLVSAGS